LFSQSWNNSYQLFEIDLEKQSNAIRRVLAASDHSRIENLNESNSIKIPHSAE
jgi:hypothetical protein